MTNHKRIAWMCSLAAGAYAAVAILAQCPIRAQDAAATHLTPVGPLLDLPVTMIPKAPYIPPSFKAVANYYVSTQGSDKNDGRRSSKPWRTISHAVSVLAAKGGTHGGVCINVGPGTYAECVYANHFDGSGDTPTGYIVFLSTKLHGATVQVPAGNTTGCCFDFDDARYIVIDGFNLVGRDIPTSIGNGFACNVDGPPGHHIKILNNIIHDNGGGGVATMHTDYVDVEGNMVYDNANTSKYEASAITLWQAVASDHLRGFHNVVRDNVVYDNTEVDIGLPYHSGCSGIQLGDFHNMTEGSKFGNYSPKSLVENNLCLCNGGAGIGLYETDNATVRNNTVYHDYLDPLLGGSSRGELDDYRGSNDVIVNNIAVADASKNPANHALQDNAGTGNVWAHNLAFDGVAGRKSTVVSGTGSTITAANGNLLGVNPLFSDPAHGKFTLRAGSPAIGAGTSDLGAPKTDLGGKPRKHSIDIGAYAYSGK